ncbi:hypothetical protein BBP40_002934 [Aspergillus hancockii]|nr:hypothetical protein BBP40_002934 [Aspergillus hancockii]
MQEESPVLAITLCKAPTGFECRQNKLTGEDDCEQENVAGHAPRRTPHAARTPGSVARATSTATPPSRIPMGTPFPMWQLISTIPRPTAPNPGSA